MINIIKKMASKGRAFGKGHGRGFSKGSKRNSNSKDDSYSEPSMDQRCPPNLRGRAIGMFYANRNKEKQKNHKEERSNVQLNNEWQDHFSYLLDEIGSSELATGTSEAKNVPNNNFFHQAYTSYLDESKLRNEGFMEVFSPEEHSLQSNAFIDDKLEREFRNLQKSPQYQRMLQFRKKLPSFQMQDKIVNLIEDNRVVVLSGETGCGKTTQVSQFILDSYISSGKGSLCRIICTQPRRISAISVAERVAEERVEKCGDNSSVGWQIRLEKKPARDYGSILYCTTGVMLQWLKSDSFLANISHIILDEIHERDLDSDFLMILLRDLMQQRPDLKLILMSATLNADMFSKYFHGCPMINIPGYTFPVQEFYLEDVIERTGFVPDPQIVQQYLKQQKWKSRGNKSMEIENDPEPFFRSLVGKYSPKTIKIVRDWDEKVINLDLIVDLLRHISLKEKNGAILVFLPGWDEIKKISTRLHSDPLFANGKFLILPLHSMMPTVNQRDIFEKPPRGWRKIILATNIAETSITIDDVVFVIDCGLAKISNFDVENNLETLQAKSISLANAKQRRGRAGRVAAGICYHLYTKYHEMTLDQYISPEMLRTRLETLCLKIKILKLGKVGAFLEKAMNPPNPKSINISIELLKKINALNDEESLTPLGFHLARLPMDPLTGRMILFGAIFSCLDPILTVAASLSFKDAFVVPLGKEEMVKTCKKDLAGETRSDHLMLAKAFYEWEEACKLGEDRRFCRDNFLSFHTLTMLAKLKDQFATNLCDLHFLPNINPKNPDFNRYSGNEMVVKAAVCAGLYPNVGKLKSKVFSGRGVPSAITEDDGIVKLHPKSVNSSERLFPSEWVVYYRKVKSTSIFLHDTTMVNPYALLFFGGKLTTGIDKDKKETVAVDNWIVFNCPKKTASIVMKLRQELDKLLQYIVEHPDDNDWLLNERNQTGLVVKAIVDLIMSEDNVSSLEQLRDQFYTYRKQN